MTPGQVLAAILLALAIGFGGAWQVQDWRMGKKLSEQAGLHKDDLAAITNAAAAQARIEQDKRLGLEGRLQSIDEAHFKEFSDAQKNISRLRDRLATADVRLSVLIDATDSASGCNVPSTTSAVGVVHAARRAQLDPAHAQRIIAITGDGDQGLIALQACQAYAKEVSSSQ
ncbi:Bacteriophage Rz lysis protein [Pseudomonas lundensis]|uniref:lysis system i-spanin subunit Rz n=1 Tax=Pseudomonas lundensis TaxID=86185 RepID=UPI000884AC32|nr:lysis system i-spanin subunit Rz [Pseudomonas lundensis]SDQ57738.1 Bacteriophage Rz lysis protein [Pseudomonas lundensis]